MLALAFVHPKLIMFYLLIGAIVGLSRFSGETLVNLTRKNDGKYWHNIVPRWR
jgi:hypothetical protein